MVSEGVGGLPGKELEGQRSKFMIRVIIKSINKICYAICVACMAYMHM